MAISSRTVRGFVFVFLVPSETRYSTLTFLDVCMFAPRSTEEKLIVFNSSLSTDCHIFQCQKLYIMNKLKISLLRDD